jgi:hypothetical protein
MKFKLATLLKLGSKEKSAPLERGNMVHEAAEAYLKGNLTRPTPELLYYAKELKDIRARRKKSPDHVIVEDQWAFTKLWGPSRWDDWSNCHLRVKIDLAEITGNVIQITDWKTGKYRPDNRETYLMQQELYATAALNVYQHITDIEVRVRLVYLDAGVVYPEAGSDDNLVYTAEDRVPLQKEWDRRVRPMFNDRQFAPKPNQFCRFCEFRKDAGGPCVY